MITFINKHQSIIKPIIFILTPVKIIADIVWKYIKRFFPSFANTISSIYQRTIKSRSVTSEAEEGTKTPKLCLDNFLTKMKVISEQVKRLALLNNEYLNIMYECFSSDVASRILSSNSGFFRTFTEHTLILLSGHGGFGVTVEYKDFPDQSLVLEAANLILTFFNELKKENIDDCEKIRDLFDECIHQGLENRSILEFCVRYENVVKHSTDWQIKDKSN